MSSNRNIRALLAASIACGGLGASGMAVADDAPLSYVADPAVYKLLAENELFRVVLATWQPGQRDAYHSHAANVVYRLKDCKGRGYKADGTVAGEAERKAGSVALQKPIASHAVENIGSNVCQVLIVERK